MNQHSINRLPGPTSTLAESPRKKPIHDVRLGAIKAAIWQNSVGDLVRYNVTFSRIYKDEAEWKTSDSFGRDDLLVLAKVADQAHTWICTATKPDRELVR
ncbi:MAG: hypothetical protein DME26_15020 [Verrucomicrobia bacterium]|nr:MAG: hypothetical protein DME26_15020 [Verrucomicrobiota bacterium]